MAAIAASIASFAAKPQNETLEGVPARETVDIRTVTHWTHMLARAIHRSLSSSLELQIDSLQTLEIRAEFRRLVPQPGGFSVAHHALSFAPPVRPPAPPAWPHAPPARPRSPRGRRASTRTCRTLLHRSRITSLVTLGFAPQNGCNTSLTSLPPSGRLLR